MRRLLVTGFGPFLEVEENPSQLLVEHLRREPAALPQDTQFAVLDVDYARAEAQLAHLLADPPALVLLTGYSRRAEGITLERRATYEFTTSRPDNAGHVPASVSREAIDNDDLDYAGMQGLLGSRGIAACQSRDAAGYLCNYTYRRTLETIADRQLSMQALFVHLPAISGSDLADSAAAHMPLGDMAQAIALIAEKLMEKS